MSNLSQRPIPSSPGSSVIPAVILSYFAAANEACVDDAVACFASDARVHDENVEHEGIDAIRQWLALSTQNYQPKTEILSARSDGEVHVVLGKVSGDFPGSPVDLEFVFGVTAEKISNLSIQ